MAIIQEHFTINGIEFIRTYSDAGVMVHGGFPEGDYEVVEDPASLNRTYTETNIPIDGEVEAKEILDILMGVQ